MPHYADGTEAKVGDQVIGRLYNSGPEPKAGAIISITPGAESCNAMVQFTEARPMDTKPDGELSAAPTMPEAPRMTVFGSNDGDRVPTIRCVKGEQHGAAGPGFVLFTCADYCATNELTKVG